MLGNGWESLIRNGADTSGIPAVICGRSQRVDRQSQGARRRLGARKVSFAPRGTATADTGMEYGGITPVGLPDGWPVLIDSAVTALPWVLVGSGARRGKLIVPGKALLALPGVTVLDGLGTEG